VGIKTKARENSVDSGRLLTGNGNSLLADLLNDVRARHGAGAFHRARDCAGLHDWDGPGDALRAGNDALYGHRHAAGNDSLAGNDEVSLHGFNGAPALNWNVVDLQAMRAEAIKGAR